MLHCNTARRPDGVGKGDGLAQRSVAVRPDWAICGLSALLAGCAPDDSGRVRICTQALHALVPEARALEHAFPAPDTVVLHYRTDLGAQSQRCTFAPRGLESDGLDLRVVETPGEGPLSPSVLFLLKTFGLGRGGQPTERLSPWAYLVQQLVNGLAPAAIYALLAAGYAVIYGITGRINLAFGEFATVGAFAALAGILIGAAVPAGVLGMALGGVLLAGVTGAALGAALYGLVFAPLHRQGSQALLIATIGLAIALGEGLRLLTGSTQRWLQPMFVSPMRLGPVAVSPSQLALPLLAAGLLSGLVAVLRRSAFGRNYRACSDDAGAAALLGVNVGRTVGQACMLGSMLAAIAGFVLAVHYGVISFTMGTILGLKALTAAVVGGIGSVRGAAVGGVVIGLFESLWAGYLPGDYRELALFALLAMMLALRPDGLFGQPAAIANPALWQPRRPPDT
jgi:branched-chain amino acid transport system permease protein